MKHLYPDDWDTRIVPAVRARSGNRCEWEGCGVRNGTYRDNGKGKEVLIVLTVMHLDHQPENCNMKNLKHACQRCHNRYDMPERIAGRKRRKKAEIEKTQTTIFEGTADRPAHAKRKPKQPG